MLVVDASVVARVVGDGGGAGTRYRQRLRDERIAAPDLLRVEVASVLRRQQQTGAISREQASAAINNLLALPIVVYPTAPLLRRSWELRDNFTAYDACYVALAEVVGGPLLTADARMAKAPGSLCAIEVI